MKSENCLICERIKLIEKGENPYFVKKVNSGYIVLGDSQYFNGYTLLLNKKHTDSLLNLNIIEKFWFFWNLMKTYKAVNSAFKPNKINVELLGNTDHHLHWHIFPRYKTDKFPSKPVWVIDEKIRNKKSDMKLVTRNITKINSKL